MPSISIPAAIGTAVAGGLTAAGVGAATAGVIGTVAGTAITGAVIGGGTAALTGGKVLKGAGYGALAGGALGGLGAAFPETMASVGIGPLAGDSATMGADGAYIPGPQGFSGLPGSGGGALASAISGGGQSVMDAAYGVPASASGGGGGGILSSLSGLSSLARPALGALAAFGRSPNQTYANMPGPATNTATLGPMWNAQPRNAGYINRTPNAALAAAPEKSWYTYGNGPEQSFFDNNAVSFPGGGALNSGAAINAAPLSGSAQAAQSGLPRNVLGPLGYAAGGRTFDTRSPDRHVKGAGDGTSDSIPAKLSDGEYVLTAQDVARIGGGSSNAGAKKLDEMRAKIARDAGAKKIQGKVKSPLQYLQKSKAA